MALPVRPVCSGDMYAKSIAPSASLAALRAVVVVVVVGLVIVVDVERVSEGDEMGEVLGERRFALEECTRSMRKAFFASFSIRVFSRQHKYFTWVNFKVNQTWERGGGGRG
jgi:hypothetical protein